MNDITCKRYKDYLKVHEKLNRILTIEYIDYIYKILTIFFNISVKALDKIEVSKIYEIYLTIALYIEDINKNINELGNKENEQVEKVKYKGSIFDEDDRENEDEFDREIEEENRYTYYLESLNYIFKYAITSCGNSIRDCLNMNIIDLVDYIDFDIEYNEEHKDDNNNNNDNG